MYQKVLMILGTILISLFFFGCSSDDGGKEAGAASTENLGKTVPSSAKVNIPSSVKKTSSKEEIPPLPTDPGTTQPSGSSTSAAQPSMGYNMISEMAKEFDDNSKDIICYLVYISAVWDDIQDQVKAKGEGVDIEFKEGELKYIFTKEMKDVIIENNRDYIAKEGEAALELEKVGEEGEMPAITFHQLKDGDESGYKYSVSLDETETIEGASLSYKYTMKWSEDTKKVSVNMDFTGTVTEGGNSMNIKGVYTIIFQKGENNDDSMTAIMSMDMGTMGKSTQTFNVKQDSSKVDKTGILFTMKAKDEMVMPGQTTALTIDFSITGKADDNGGFIKAVMKMPAMTMSGMSIPAQTMHMKENWDPKGTLLGSSYSTDGKTWTASSGYAAPSGEYVMDDSQMSAMSDSVGAGTKVKLKAGASIVATTSDMAYLDKSYQIFPTGVIPSSETMDRTIGYAYYDYTSDYSSLVLKIDFWGPSTLIPSAVLYSVTGFDANQFPIFGTGTANVLE